MANDWEEKGMRDGYHVFFHIPCGTGVLILPAHSVICPKCQPEEWAKERGER
jgi:hypothetical protein